MLIVWIQCVWACACMFECVLNEGKSSVTSTGVSLR